MLTDVVHVMNAGPHRHWTHGPIAGNRYCTRADDCSMHPSRSRSLPGSANAAVRVRVRALRVYRRLCRGGARLPAAPLWASISIRAWGSPALGRVSAVTCRAEDSCIHRSHARASRTAGRCAPRRGPRASRGPPAMGTSCGEDVLEKSLTKTSCIRDASRCVRARGEQVHKAHRSPPTPPLSYDVFAESFCNRFGGTSGKACRRPSSACAGHRRAPPPPYEPRTLGPHATAYNPPPLPAASRWRRISWNAHEHEPGRTQAW